MYLFQIPRILTLIPFICRFSWFLRFSSFWVLIYSSKEKKERKKENFVGMDGFGVGGGIEEPPNPEDLNQHGDNNPSGFAFMFPSFKFCLFFFLLLSWVFIRSGVA